MKLGYLNIPPKARTCGSTHGSPRASLAHRVGFTDFYSNAAQRGAAANSAFCDSPEHADMLNKFPDFPKPPQPQIVEADQSASNPSPTAHMVVPTQTAAQVRANIQQSNATLSVSWLGEDQLSRHWAAHVQASTHARKRACPSDWHVARTIVICDDPQRAEAAVKSPDSPCRAYYAQMAQAGASAAEVDALLDACVLWGNLNTVLDALDDLVVSSGPFGTLTLVDHAWPDDTLATDTIATLASAFAPMQDQKRMAI